MRQWSYTILFLAISTPLIVRAEPFRSRINTPADFHEALYGVKELQDNIQAVQCGGWEPTIATIGGQTVTGNIPLPAISTDIPGRRNINPLGDPVNGMGVRGQFEYPGSAWGFMSACNINHEGQWLETSLRDGSGFVIPQKINPQKLCQTRYDTATPEKCKELYDHLEGLKTNFPRNYDVVCEQKIERKYCFDLPNTLCNGNGCRPTNGPGFSYTRPREVINQETGECTIIPAQFSFTPRSYYRHYGGGNKDNLRVAQAAVTDPSSHVWRFRVECYGWYNERDPKTEMTYHIFGNNGISLVEDQCEIVIANPSEQNPEKPEWKTAGPRKQKGKVSSVFPASASASSRSAPALWTLDTESNLSLLDIEKFSNTNVNFDDQNDLLSMTTTLIPVHQRASVVTTKTHTDMFDDTGERRIAKWWEAQQKEALKITRDQSVKFLLPARFLLGLDPKDPLVVLAQQKPIQPNGVVEVTVQIGSEELSAILQSFEQLYVLPIRQVRIPVLVPMVSENELSTRITEWEIWKQNNEQDAAVTAKADEVIGKLKEYQTQLKTVRRIRAVLPTYTEKLFSLQGQVRKYMGEWLTENATMFEKYAELSTKRQDVRKSWKEVEQAMNVVTECQLLWCSNHRFTLPIYSLLHNWYRRWYEPNELPDLRDLNYTAPKDLEFDFSAMGFAAEEFLIPVLWPVQVRINIPLIPISPSDPIPDLPSLPLANVFSNLPVPTVTLPSKRVIPSPDATNDVLLDSAKGKILDMRNRIGGSQTYPMDKRVGFFRNSMQDAYCRFSYSIVIPPSLDTNIQNTNKIVHIENDLNERLQRLFARWSPNQYEDFLAKQARLRADFTTPQKPKCSDDGVCIDLPAEKETRRSWQWFSPESAQDFTQLYEQMIPSFIENDDETENPFLQSIRVLKRLFPTLNIPDDTEIILRSTTP